MFISFLEMKQHSYFGLGKTHCMVCMLGKKKLNNYKYVKYLLSVNIFTCGKLIIKKNDTVNITQEKEFHLRGWCDNINIPTSCNKYINLYKDFKLMKQHVFEIHHIPHILNKNTGVIYMHKETSTKSAHDFIVGKDPIIIGEYLNNQNFATTRLRSGIKFEYYNKEEFNFIIKDITALLPQQMPTKILESLDRHDLSVSPHINPLQFCTFEEFLEFHKKNPPLADLLLKADNERGTIQDCHALSNLRKELTWQIRMPNSNLKKIYQDVLKIHEEDQKIHASLLKTFNYNSPFYNSNVWLSVSDILKKFIEM
jgi:hypothetical protein